MIVVENRPTQDHFSKVSIYNFSGLKNIKKGSIEMTEKIYLESFEKCPGLVCFPLLTRSSISIITKCNMPIFFSNHFNKEISSDYNSRSRFYFYFSNELTRTVI